MIRYTTFSTPLGKMFLAASDRGICRLDFVVPGRNFKSWFARHYAGESLRADGRTLRSTVKKLHDYFQGKHRRLDLPVELRGTAFERRVWQALQKIGRGETTTYGRLAARLGRPHAARAVGRAVGLNPIAVVVPCHRVVGSDGRLVGYASGLKRKAKLLALEGALAKGKERARA